MANLKHPLHSERAPSTTARNAVLPPIGRDSNGTPDLLTLHAGLLNEEPAAAEELAVALLRPLRARLNNHFPGVEPQFVWGMALSYYKKCLKGAK